MSANVVNNKFSARLASKVHRLKKMLKPVMSLLHSTKKRSAKAAVAQQSKAESFYSDDSSDLDQNAANEALESRVREDIIRSCSEDGGEVSLWIDGHLTVVQGQLERIPIPVKFAYTPAGDFFWAPLPDSDVCLGRARAHNIHTSGQTAEKQVPHLAR